MISPGDQGVGGSGQTCADLPEVSGAAQRMVRNHWRLGGGISAVVCSVVF